MLRGCSINNWSIMLPILVPCYAWKASLKLDVMGHSWGSHWLAYVKAVLLACQYPISVIWSSRGDIFCGWYLLQVQQNSDSTIYIKKKQAWCREINGVVVEIFSVGGTLLQVQQNIDSTIYIFLKQAWCREITRILCQNPCEKDTSECRETMWHCWL